MTMNKGLVGFVLTLMALVVFAGTAAAQNDPHWVKTDGINNFPVNAEIGGTDKDGLKLPLCWANYLGGIHPGKVFQKKCLIPYGGLEIPTTGSYMVYVGRVQWQTGTSTQLGNLNAITGAIENGTVRPLCQAVLAVNGQYIGTYAGKVIAGKCNVGWGNKEWPVDTYKVGFDNTPLQAVWFSNKIYRIISIKSGKGAIRTLGNSILQSSEKKVVNEQWQMAWAGGGYYRIKTFTSDLCLDSTGVTRTTNGPVQLRQCAMIDSQMWLISTYEASKSLIISKDTGRVLNVNLGSVDDGAAIYLWERNRAPHQLWRFETVSTPASLQYQCEASLDGQVPWNRAGSKDWLVGNRQNLCAGTKNPEGTIACFVDFITNKKDDYGQAMQACRTK